MFSFLRNILFLNRRSFVIDKIDRYRNVVVLQDKLFNLRIEIPIGDKPLIKARVVGPHAVLLIYEDGSSKKRRILN